MTILTPHKYIKEKGLTEYRITGRDEQVVLDVYKYRYLSASQLQNLHFPSERVAYRRLQALTTLRYLSYFTVPNIHERVYHLDAKGAELVAGHLEVDVKNLAWHKVFHSPKDYYFLRHFLKLNDFRLQLTAACQNDVKLLGFIPDYYGTKIEGSVGKYIRDHVCDIANPTVAISHTPDAVFCLQKAGGNAALFFLEIDRGTESLTNPAKGFLKAIHFYLNYWVEGKFKRYSEDFNCPPFNAFRVLVVTTNDERAQNMRDAGSSVSFPKTNIKRFFWVTTEEQLTKETILSPLWQSLDSIDNKTYGIG
jgi:Replication-relaxation